MADRPSNPSNKPSTRSEPGGQLFQRLSAELASERELSAEEAELRAELARLEARLARAEQATERCGQLGEELEQLRPRLGYEFNLPLDASLAIIGQLGKARCRAAMACRGLRAAVGSAKGLGAFRHRVLAVCASGYDGQYEYADDDPDTWTTQRGHTAVCTGDAVFSFGGGKDGQLGYTAGIQATPRMVTGLLDQDVVAAASSERSTLVCTAEGQVYWFGRLHDEGSTHVPQLVGGLQQVVGVAAGDNHLLAWARSGELYTWGHGRWGQLGHGGEEDEAGPRLVEGLAGSTVVGADGGELHSVVCTASGRVYTFGYGRAMLGHGQGGADTHPTPRLVEALVGSTVVAVTAGRDKTAAINEAGELYTWGDLTLGHGDQEDDEETEFLPRLVAGLVGKRVAGVSAGDVHMLAWTDSGELYSWGWGQDGRLGHNSADQDEQLPRRVERLAGKAVAGAAAGCWHSVVVTRDQKVYTFGNNESGGLGHGAEVEETLDSACMPKEVAGLKVGIMKQSDNVVQRPSSANS